VCVFLAQSVHIGIADGVVLHLVGVRRQIVVRWIVGKTWCAIHITILLRLISSNRHTQHWVPHYKSVLECRHKMPCSS
jgi:hypothetical protein